MKTTKNTWACKTCTRKFKTQGNESASFCPYCAGKDIRSEESIQRVETYAKYDAELTEITEKMNELMCQFKPLHERYERIMEYWRQQKTRRLITDDEYDERSSTYRYRSVTFSGQRRGRKPLCQSPEKGNIEDAD